MEVIGGGKVPLENEVLELGEAVALVYGTPGAEASLRRLSEQAEILRDWLYSSNKQAWMVFLQRLILACPPLLLHPKEFTWFFQDFFWVLRGRKFNRDIDRDYWASLERLRRVERKGRPPEILRDLRRDQAVEDIVNPPKEMLPFVKKLSKTRAVEQVAEWEGIADVQGIWQSLQNAKKYFAGLNNRLEAVSQGKAGDQQKQTSPSRKRLKR